MADAGIYKLRRRQISELGDELLHARRVHLLPVRPPVSAIPCQAIRLWPVVHFDLAGVIEAEIKDLFLAEIVESLVHRLTEIAVYLIGSFDGARFRVIRLLVFSDLQFLRGALVRD